MGLAIVVLVFAFVYTNISYTVALSLASLYTFCFNCTYVHVYVYEISEKMCSPKNFKNLCGLATTTAITYWKVLHNFYPVFKMLWHCN